MHPLKREFIDLFNKSGWTQAETARQLGFTRGGINGIITGPTVPSLATVKLLRLLVGSETGRGPAKAAARPAGRLTRDDRSWNDLLRDLESLDPPQREQVAIAVRQMIRALSRPRGGKKR